MAQSERSECRVLRALNCLGERNTQFVSNLIHTQIKFAVVGNPRVLGNKLQLQSFIRTTCSVSNSLSFLTHSQQPVFSSGRELKAAHMALLIAEQAIWKEDSLLTSKQASCEGEETVQMSRQIAVT